MEWVILFIASWILFILLADWKKLKTNIWCGLLAIALQISIDSQAMSRSFYKVTKQFICIGGSSSFFVFGPVLVIATLIAQYHPRKRWMRIFNIFIFSGLYSIQELLLLARGNLLYLNWDFIDSIIVNMAVMSVLSWFTIVVLDKKGEVKQ